MHSYARVVGCTLMRAAEPIINGRWNAGKSRVAIAWREASVVLLAGIESTRGRLARVEAGGWVHAHVGDPPIAVLDDLLPVVYVLR